MTAPALPLPGGGKMRMQPVYVENVVSAIMASLGFGDGKLAKSPLWLATRLMRPCWLRRLHRLTR
jgi:hypothetical protein